MDQMGPLTFFTIYISVSTTTIEDIKYYVQRGMQGGEG